MRITENEFKKRFKVFLERKGFKIIKEITNGPPDLVIEKDGDVICVELKVSRGQNLFGIALYQLLFAKSVFRTKKLWLVISGTPTSMSKKWIKLLWNYRISIFLFDRTLKRLRLRNLLPSKPLKERIYQKIGFPIYKTRRILKMLKPTLLRRPDDHYETSLQKA